MTDNWDAWQYLLGDWVNENVIDPSQGYGKFSFRFDLDKNILVRESRTVFPASGEKGPSTHDDLMIIYTEMNDSKRAIYFDNEGHVIHYEINISSDKNIITLLSEARPGIPQFRFTYIKTSEQVLEARFEIAPRGGSDEFSTYLQGSARRTNAG